MSSYEQAAIERTYRSWARVYEWLTPVYLLGNEDRLRRQTVGSLDLRPGQTVLDVACGTGRNFPLIMERIGPAGRLVGLDYTGAMLDRARERVAREGWQNVTLIQGDATRMAFGQTFDAALCTLAMGVIPDERAALAGMLTHLKPGGRLAIGDAKRSVGLSGLAFNWLAELLGYGAAEVMTRRPWELLRETLSDYHYAEWCLGFFYVAGGRIAA